MAPNPPVDRRKVRLGLALVTVAFVAAVILFFVVDDALGRAVMAAVAVTAAVRLFLLTRSLRGDRSPRS